MTMGVPRRAPRPPPPPLHTHTTSATKAVYNRHYNIRFGFWTTCPCASTSTTHNGITFQPRSLTELYRETDYKSPRIMIT